MSGPRSQFISETTTDNAGKEYYISQAMNALLLTSSHYRLKNGGWSGGGPFYVYKQSKRGEVTDTGMWIRNGVKSGGKICSPLITPTPLSYPSATTLAGKVSADQTLCKSLCPTGFRRTRPGNPVASVFQAVVEGYRDGLPAIPLIRSIQRKVSFLRGIGNEYLNVVFGWKPLINDLRKIFKLTHDIDKRMDQIVRENNHWIHRKATLDEQSTVTNSSHTYPYLFPQASFSPPGGWTTGTTIYTVSTETVDRRWYSACYKYYIRDTMSLGWNARARAVLFGVMPTPEAIWSVIPWSWLVDWFSNVGDVLSNLSQNAVDNLVQKYGYVMHQNDVTTTYGIDCSWVPSPHHDEQNNVPGGSCLLQTTVFTGTRARGGSMNPFGVDVQFDSLSNYQIGILAALGLSKGLVK